MKECYDIEIGKDTAGQPIMSRRCFCGTTACLQEKIQNYAVVEQVKFMKSPDCDCLMEWQLADPNILCEKCKERRKEMYKDIFGKGIL